MTQPGPVYIVGAGPGDPDLLTMRAHRLIREEAEVVVYDRLIPQAILDLIPPSVETIYAGKSCRKHHMTQAEINACLVEQAQKGKKVVRLKGGDPFIFGRGGEEAEHLLENNIPFEVIPGISAASGISAHLGIPLTHRGLANGVHFITGHQQNGVPVALENANLANPDTTLVIYMGLANLHTIVNHLLEHGMPADTPSIVIQEGTTPQERIATSPLQDLPQLVEKQEFSPPSLIIIGKVVEVAKWLKKI